MLRARSRSGFCSLVTTLMERVSLDFCSSTVSLAAAMRKGSLGLKGTLRPAASASRRAMSVGRSMADVAQTPSGSGRSTISTRAGSLSGTSAGAAFAAGLDGAFAAATGAGASGITWAWVGANAGASARI